MAPSHPDDRSPLGEPLEWMPRPRPQRGELRGVHALLRAPQPTADARALYACSHPPAGDETIWTYLFDGPYKSVETMRVALERMAVSEDPLFFTIVAGGGPAGVASYLRITPEHGSIEIGNVWFGPPLRRTRAATEAIYLLAGNAFDALGYRRLEWKCNALNLPSRRAAERFGFRFEGVFRNHMVVKGRNRDTAWFAITAQDWPGVRDGFQAWLADENFNAAGIQRRSLASLMPS